MNGFHKNYKVIQLFVAKENIIFHAFFRYYITYYQEGQPRLEILSGIFYPCISNGVNLKEGFLYIYYGVHGLQ